MYFIINFASENSNKVLIIINALKELNVITN